MPALKGRDAVSCGSVKHPRRLRRCRCVASRRTRELAPALADRSVKRVPIVQVHAGMEALIANLLEPGETIIVGNNGASPRRFYQMHLLGCVIMSGTMQLQLCGAEMLRAVSSAVASL